MRKALVIIALTIITAALSLSARAFTGEQLAAMCRTHDNSPMDLICDAYVAGFVAGLSSGSVLSRTSTRICIPERLAPGDVRPVIEAFFARKPPGSIGAASAVAAALYSAYPCKPGEEPK
jgi:hypothetical protein